MWQASGLERHRNRGELAKRRFLRDGNNEGKFSELRRL